MRSRAVEILAALSLTTDLATGMPFEKGLAVCLVADEISATLTLDPSTRRAVFHTSLLRSIGCTSFAPENATEFVDDTAFQRALKTLDPGRPEAFRAQLRSFGDWAGEHQAELADRFMTTAPALWPVASATGCEVSRALAPSLGADDLVVRALEDIYERWDGTGTPAGRRQDELALPTRVVHTAEQAVLAGLTGGRSAASVELGRRSGGQLDPAVVNAFDPRMLEVADEPDLLAAVVDREPEPWLWVDDPTWMHRSLGTVADLKSVHLIGHSTHLARIVGRAADGDHARRLESAALLHNLGCVVVPSTVLDTSRTLSAADRERMRLHCYWTQRILERCPSLADLAPITRPAAAHHAAFAEGGHLAWSRPDDLPPFAAMSWDARLLEAAEAYASLIEPRPGRPGLPGRDAAVRLCAARDAGLVDRAATDRILDSLGLQARDTPPNPLSAKEQQVLELTARGLSNRSIAQALFISDRTVGHHLAHIYDKTGYRTRAGVAVWAVRHGLIPSER